MTLSPVTTSQTRQSPLFDVEVVIKSFPTIESKYKVARPRMLKGAGQERAKGGQDNQGKASPLPQLTIFAMRTCSVTDGLIIKNQIRLGFRFDLKSQREIQI